MFVQCRGIRGATTVDRNDAESILSATRELLQKLIDDNEVHQEDVASVIFSSTSDLSAAFPARAARDLGWSEAPLFGCQEVDVTGGLARCIRVLVHWNTTKPASAIRHAYLRQARTLRPDRAPEE
jgi:chorismate mutase